MRITRNNANHPKQPKKSVPEGRGRERGGERAEKQENGRNKQGEKRGKGRKREKKGGGGGQGGTGKEEKRWGRKVAADRVFGKGKIR